MQIRNFAKIGKSFLVKALGIQRNYKEVITYEVEDNSRCKNCMVMTAIAFDSATDTMMDYCVNTCRKNIVKKEKVIYHNEFNRHNIPVGDYTNIRLSRLQLSQMMLYHFLGPNEQGIIKNISIKEIANILNCTTKSVRNNNERLADLGYIMYAQSISDDHFNVGIIGFDKYHLSKEDDGTGYITAYKTTMEEIVKMNTVNGLRMLLRQLLVYDNTNTSIRVRKEVSLSYRQAKQFLPRYLDSKNKIDEYIKETTNMFDLDAGESTISFKLKDKFNGKLQKEIITEIALNELAGFFLKYDLDTDDLFKAVDLGVIYGLDIVIESLNDIYDEYIYYGEEIHNFGGLLHNRIKTIQNNRAI